MISKLKFGKVRRRTQLLLAVSVSGLISMSLAHAGQAAQESAIAPQGAGNPYAGPAAVPPPPGPYGHAPASGGSRFRPDIDLEGNVNAVRPGAPADFSNGAGRGSLTRQQFIEQREAHRKQMDAYYQQREAEMNKRVEDMQKRMDTIQTQGAAGSDTRMGIVPPAALERARSPEDVGQSWEQQRAEQERLWEQQKAEQEKRWEQQKAEQDQRMQQMKTEHEKRLEHLKAQQEQSQYRVPDTTITQQAPSGQAPVQQPTAPAYGYGYPPPAYGYPPPQYGYGGQGRGYPQQAPAPALNGRQQAR